MRQINKSTAVNLSTHAGEEPTAERTHSGGKNPACRVLGLKAI